MKKTFLLAVIFLFCAFAKAQTNIYHPFPDSNAIWRVDWGEGFCYNNSFPQAQYQYEMQGDTLIGSYIYHKILRVMGFGGYICGPYYIPGAGYKGAIRQDTTLRKIYFVPKDTAQEELLYDFNLNIGDTIRGKFVGGIVVQNIDSILIGSNYRRQINWGLIEGIGSATGLLEPRGQLELTPQLRCFIQNGNTLFQISAVCDLPNIIDDSFIDEHAELILFPQPASTYIIARLSDHSVYGKMKVTLFDIVGRLISIPYHIENDFIKINTSGIKSGIYQFHLQETNTQKTYISKIVIQ